MSRSIAIVDCGVGNHASVRNALRLLGEEPVVTSDPVAIAAATHLILPGVGAFAQGMVGIRERNLKPVLDEQVLKKKKPILGLCLGMQLFLGTGLEHGTHEGLGWIRGTVSLIDTTMRLPHIGWNNVTLTGLHRINRGLATEPVFYFVHSYHPIPEDPSVIAGTCDYGGTVNAILEQGNIMGAQFHPEKSHDDGMQIFRNFLSC